MMAMQRKLAKKACKESLQIKLAMKPAPNSSAVYKRKLAKKACNGACTSSVQHRVRCYDDDDACSRRALDSCKATPAYLIGVIIVNCPKAGQQELAALMLNTVFDAAFRTRGHF